MVGGAEGGGESISHTQSREKETTTACALRHSMHADSPSEALPESVPSTAISAMSGSGDVSMAETDDALDGSPPESAGYGVGDPMVTEPMSALSSTTVAIDGEVDDQQPRSCTTRTRSQRATEGPSEVSTKGEPAGYTSKGGVVSPDARGPLAAISDDQLVERGLKVVACGSKLPTSSGECGIGGTVLVEHCVRSRGPPSTPSMRRKA